MSKEIWTAVVTPFTKDNRIDFNSLKKIILQLKRQKTDGVVLAGSTGEAATLSAEEKISLFKFGSQFRDKNFKIMAGVGTNDTQKTLELVDKVNSIKIDSLLVVSPYYNKPSQSDLFLHFKSIADKSTHPVIIYEIPSRTGVSISVETILKLSKHKNILGVKESNPDIMRIFRIKSGSSRLQVFSGDDSSFLPSMSLGSDGLISVLSHIIAADIVKLSREFDKGNHKTCFRIQSKILKYSDAVFSVTNPVGIKSLLSRKGIIENFLRPPLNPIPKTHLKLIGGNS